jgi:glycosyltransferase involved in cell wall biosynthesis
MPKISVIIPTLNEEPFIGQTIRLLKAALSVPHEIIVTDGHSSDRTVEIARAAGADRVVEHDGSHRQTIAEGRNAGARAASGEFLVFMDADCSIPGPDYFFDKVLSHFDRDQKLVALNVAIRVLPGAETFADWAVYNMFNDYLWFMNNILHAGMGAGEFQMARKSAFDSIGGYNEKLVASEDIDLFSRLSKVGRVRYEKGLKVYHPGRRAHKIGWPKLLTLWTLNSLSVQFRGKAFVDEWKPIR